MDATRKVPGSSTSSSARALTQSMFVMPAATARRSASASICASTVYSDGVLELDGQRQRQRPRAAADVQQAAAAFEVEVADELTNQGRRILHAPVRVVRGAAFVQRGIPAPRLAPPAVVMCPVSRSDGRGGCQ